MKLVLVAAALALLTSASDLAAFNRPDDQISPKDQLAPLRTTQDVHDLLRPSTSMTSALREDIVFNDCEALDAETDNPGCPQPRKEPGLTGRVDVD